MRRLLFLTAAALATACGGSRSAAGEPSNAHIAEAPVPADQRPPRGSLWRDEVDAVVDGGLGRFLQFVEVEPSLSQGRFRGFRIVELRPTEFWSDVDLKRGDVVTRVNDMPIERETEAFEAFSALRKSSSLRVKYLRGGEERELVFKIVDRPSAPPPKKSEAKSKKSPDAG